MNTASEVTARPSLREEERQALAELLAESEKLTEALCKKRRKLSPQQREHLRQLRGHLDLSDHGQALQVLRRLLAQEYGERREVAQRLEVVLQTASSLEPCHRLPTALGRELRGAFMARVAEHPQELVELLLGTLDEARSPEGNLLLVIQRLRFNLRAWRDLLASERQLLSQEHELLRLKLLKLTSGWCGTFDELTRGEVGQGRETLQGMVRLLRWRLERCEDVLALPKAWSFYHGQRRRSSPLKDVNFKIFASLQRELFHQGATPLSVDTWDTLVAAVFSLVDQAERAREWQTKEGLEFHQTFMALEGCGSSLAQAVTALEEDLVTMPQEMKQAFLEKALMHCATRESTLEVAP